VIMSETADDACAICMLTLEFDSPESAQKVHKSVEMDNLGYLESRVEGSRIVAEIEAGSMKSLLHTLDDFLACTAIASKIVSKKS
jgi:tRNA threonylcarbamoyladenosine modification (KEOPS) complex  Pcc1 subunit